MKTLNKEYFLNPDILFLSKDLLGKFLFTKINGVLTGGIIIETEAYKGPEDKASHGYNNRRTKRTETLFQEGGVCYIYLIYGIYSLFNIVTNRAGIPNGILIRAIHPIFGVEEMMKRRKTQVFKNLASGPGTLTIALGIDRSLNGFPLGKPPIWVEDRGVIPDKKEIIIGPRIGVDYAGEDSTLPWRFRWVTIFDNDNKYS